MQWEDTEFGQFVDEKIEFFNFKNTLVCLGAWKNNQENLAILQKIGNEVFWFGMIGTDSADLHENYFGAYFVKINNEEHKELGALVFKNDFKGIYGRYYRGLEAVEVYRKEPVF